MFSIDINGKLTDCEINFGTALDYELEFGKDMVADVNGSIKEGEEGFVTLDENDNVVGINFHAVPWTTFLKVLWCSVKTRDPKVKSFRKWAEEMRGIDMMEARLKLSTEMEDCFFRNSVVASEQEGASE